MKLLIFLLVGVVITTTLSIVSAITGRGTLLIVFGVLAIALLVVLFYCWIDYQDQKEWS
nr:hypothetical protein 7 [bacterium]